MRRKNELSYWSPVSRAYSIFRSSSAGTLAGLPALRQGRNLHIKPLLFFSRRIGLTDAGEREPLHGGVRLTGRAGGFTLGLMTMQSKDEGGRPSTNYTVARVRRDLFRSSDIGFIVLSREPSLSRRSDAEADDSADFNRVAGVDANFRFFRNFSINGFFARSESRGVTTDQDSAKASIGWEDSKKRLQTSIMKIGEGFRDDLGCVRRTGIRAACSTVRATAWCSTLGCR